MRNVTLTAYQYRHFVYPAVGRSVIENPDEWDVALRTVRKLKDPALTAEVPLTAEEQERRENGEAVIPERHLTGPQATFVLEEDEHGLLLRRINGFRRVVALAAADDMETVVELVKNAKPVTIAPA